MIRTTRNRLLWLLCLLFCSSLHAQYFKNKAALGPVAKTGFYAIDITSELSSYVKVDFSDLRIMDGDNKQVPYVIKSISLPVSLNSGIYRDVSILKNQLADSGKSILLLDNSKKDNIGKISLVIKNTSVSRMANFSGSDDGQHWYSIMENISLQKSYTIDSSSYIEEIIFPFSSYKFFRLVIYNGRNDPLNIVSAKVANVPTVPLVDIGDVKKYETNPACSIMQKDSTDGYSYIQVYSNAAFHTSRIRLQVKGPKFFKREADVLIPYQAAANFTISSDTVFSFYLPVFNNKDWLVKIYNGDNPPLKITGIAAAQEAKKIIAWLEEGKTYHLAMNDSAAQEPLYDLQSFKDSIPKDIAAIKYGAVETADIAKPVATTSVFKKPVLWAIVVAIVVGLLFFTTKLSKEVAKEQ